MPAKTPEQQAAYDKARARPKQILLRLTPDEVQQLRDAAAKDGCSITDYVMSTVGSKAKVRISRDVDLGDVTNLADVAKISAATVALAGAPKAIQKLDADLGRLSGRLAHLFTLNPKEASLHRPEIHETLRELHDLMSRVLPEIDHMQKLVAPARRNITLVMREVALHLRAVRADRNGSGRVT